MMIMMIGITAHAWRGDPNLAPVTKLSGKYTLILLSQVYTDTPPSGAPLAGDPVELMSFTEDK